MDESNIQRKSLPVENSCALISKLNNSVCTNTSSYEETSPENCSVDHEADLKHSREVCHVCFVCCVGGNLKHCGKCLQSYHLQCLDNPHKEKKHIEVSGKRQILIKTIPTSLDEVPSQRDAYGNKSSGKKVGSSSNANAGALVDDNNVGGRLVSQLVMNSAVITADFVRQKSSSSAAAFERKSSSECDGSSPRLNTSNLEDTDSFSRNKLDKLGGDSACVKQVDHPIDYFLLKE
ncbi:hypothetical protein ACE6H2_008135 [Prunus campanulata]